MNNGRFAISTHILTLLASAKGEVLSSEFIAGSVNINPVLIRKEIINLRKYGLVASKEGKNGGSYLNKPAKDIRMSDVYEAVRQASVLGQTKNRPNPKCPVGRQINDHLEDLYQKADQAILRDLDTITLEEFCGKFEM